MKRLHILTRPTSVSEIDDLETDEFMDKEWGQKAERARLRRWRRVKQQEV